jgi:hypothetical protein
MHTASAVVEAFRYAGFSTGPLVANNFSIEGADVLFKKYFSITPAQALNTRQSTELPLDFLPQAVRAGVQAIVFTKPPDFGPGGAY